MITISINGNDRDMPENWGEVPKENIAPLMNLVYLQPDNGSTTHQVLRLLLCYKPTEYAVMMRRYFNPKSTDSTREANAEALLDLTLLTKWLWQETNTARPFAYFDHALVRWQLPNERLKRMSFGELTAGFIAARGYIETQSVAQLDRLVATICRPEASNLNVISQQPDWKGDHREPFNSYAVDARKKVMETVDFEVKALILIWFMASVKEFMSYYDIFEEGAPDDAGEDYPAQGYIKNQHLLAEKGIFGNLDQTKEANIYDVFLFLHENHQDIKAEIAAMKVQNS